jgi:hypothetical protein
MARPYLSFSWLLKIVYCTTILCLLGGFSACRTASIPPLDLSASGWKLLQGQALWKAQNNGVELAGELLVAVHEDGRCFVQFTKTPFTFVVAQQQADRWQIEFPLRQIRLTGRGRSPSRFPWLHLSALVNRKALPPEWQVDQTSDGRWRLEHRRTGETLQGYLGP